MWISAKTRRSKPAPDRRSMIESMRHILSRSCLDCARAQPGSYQVRGEPRAGLLLRQRTRRRVNRADSPNVPCQTPSPLSCRRKNFFNKTFHLRIGANAKNEKPRKRWAFAASDRAGRKCGDGVDMRAADLNCKSRTKQCFLGPIWKVRNLGKTFFNANSRSIKFYQPVFRVEKFFPVFRGFYFCTCVTSRTAPFEALVVSAA